MDLKNFTIASIKQVYCIEISISGTDFNNRILLVERAKGEVKIVKHLSVNDMQEDIPIVLSIAGKDVISKIEKESGDLNSFLSNLRVEDFLIQSISTQDFHGIHLIRNETFEEILQNLEIPKDRIIAINLGGFVLSHFAEFLFLENGAFEFGRHNFQWNQNIVQYDFKSENSDSDKLVAIGEERIPSQDVIPFVIAFLILSGQEEELFDIHANCLQNKERFLYQINTSLLLKYGLAAIFLLAIINFGFFSWFNSQKKDLENKYQTLIPMAETNKKLRAENLKYDELFEAHLNGISLAFMADQFIVNMPDEIILEKMCLFPAIKEGNEKNTDFEINKVLISGETQGPENLHVWTSKLKEIEWINEAKITNYTSAKRKGRPEFTLVIEI